MYELGFYVRRNNAWEPVTGLPVLMGELVLVAHVYEEGTGEPAQRGTALFEYCSFGGRPNDIEKADEAPLSACQDGTADWRRLGSQRFDGTCPDFGAGYACQFFGVVQIPRSIGFRVRYQPQGGVIAPGSSPELEFTWTAQ